MQRQCWTMQASLIWVVLAGLLWAWPVRSLGDDKLYKFPFLPQSHWEVDPMNGAATYQADAKSLETPSIDVERDALTNNTILLAIESDARSVKLVSGSVQISIDVHSARTHELFLSLKGEDATLYMDGVELAPQKRQWQALVGKGDSIHIQWVGASHVALHYKMHGEAPVAATMQAERGSSTAAGVHEGQSPAAGAADSFSLWPWRKAVFRLRTRDAGKSVSTSGTAFLVAADGVAITSFHVVEGASNGVALFDGMTKEIPVELWAADPANDLAIIKVRFEKPGDVPQALTLSQQLPAAKSDVLAVGYSEAGLTTAKGVVSEVRDLVFIERGYTKGLRYSADCRFIQVDCPINHDNAGGPLLNSQGQVTGITTWCARRSDDRDLINHAYYAVDIGQARKLLADLPDKPLTFSAAVQKYGQTITPAGGFPSVSVARTLAAAELSSRMSAMVTSIACPKCGGTGKVLVSHQVGMQQSGPVSHPIMKTESETCPVCAGDGYNAKAFTAQAAAVVDTIARLNPDDKNLSKQLDDASHRLWTMEEKFPKAFGQLDLAENWSASRKKNPVGTQVMLVGDFVEKLEDGTEDPLYIVKCGKVSYAMTHLASMHASKGDKVLFGGIFAGGMAMGDGAEVPVLQGGIMISDDAKSGGAGH